MTAITKTALVANGFRDDSLVKQTLEMDKGFTAYGQLINLMRTGSDDAIVAFATARLTENFTRLLKHCTVRVSSDGVTAQGTRDFQSIKATFIKAREGYTLGFSAEHGISIQPVKKRAGTAGKANSGKGATAPKGKAMNVAQAHKEWLETLDPEVQVDKVTDLIIALGLDVGEVTRILDEKAEAAAEQAANKAARQEPVIEADADKLQATEAAVKLAKHAKVSLADVLTFAKPGNGKINANHVKSFIANAA